MSYQCLVHLQNVLQDEEITVTSVITLVHEKKFHSSIEFGSQACLYLLRSVTFRDCESMLVCLD